MPRCALTVRPTGTRGERRSISPNAIGHVQVSVNVECLLLAEAV